VGDKILMLERGFQTRDLFEDACRAAHVQLQVRIESRSPQSLVALAAAGHGIAILPSVVRLDRPRWPLRGCCTMDGLSVYGDAWSGTLTGTYQPTRATSSRSLHAARGRHIQVTGCASPARCLGRLMRSKTIASNPAQVSCCVHAGATLLETVRGFGSPVSILAEGLCAS
jgi:hypothetical protein